MIIKHNGRMVINGTNGYQDSTGVHLMTCSNAVYHYRVDAGTDTLYLFEEDGTALAADTVEYRIVGNWWGL